MNCSICTDEINNERGSNVIRVNLMFELSSQKAMKVERQTY